MTDIARSPDGERVAFVTAESVPDDDERIASSYVAPTDGSRAPHRLTRLPGAADPAWGPGGDRLAFTSCRTERPDATMVRDCWTIPPDGSDLRKLTGSDLGITQPTWDADGDRLAFAGRDPENWCIPTQVYVHDLGGDHWQDDDRRDDEGASDASAVDHVGRYESITDVGALDTPLPVMAGGEDWRCAPTQSEQLYVSARRQGVDGKLVVYPDEHHDIGDPDRAIHRLETILDWYERHDPAVEDGGAV